MKSPARTRSTADGPEQPKAEPTDTGVSGADGSTSFPDAPDGLREAAVAALPELCELIKRKTGHDFSRYKQSTLGRRVARRVSVLRLESVDEYSARLQHDVKEVENLFNDLLIGV